jgi:hypothetical protein
VNTLVLSGTSPVVPSRTRSSCYWEPKGPLTFCLRTKLRDSNFSKRESNFFGAAPLLSVIAICRTPPAHSELNRKRLDASVAVYSRPVRRLQEIVRRLSRGNIAVASCCSVQELSAIRRRFGNYRTDGQVPIRNCHLAYCIVLSSPIARKRHLLVSVLWPLESWTRVPLIADRRNGEPAFGESFAATPGTVFAHQSSSDVFGGGQIGRRSHHGA